MTHGTIIFPIIFPIMTHGTIIFLLWHIISHYCSYYFQLWHGDGTRRIGMCSQQFLSPDPLTQEWLISVDEECQLNCINWMASIQKGKQPDALFQDYYTHYFYYYAHYFSWLTSIVVTVSTSYALQIYEHRFSVLQRAKGTSGKLALLSEVPRLFSFCAIILHYITIIAIIFSIIWIIPEQKVAIGVGIHCR